MISPRDQEARAAAEHRRQVLDHDADRQVGRPPDDVDDPEAGPHLPGRSLGAADGGGGRSRPLRLTPRPGDGGRRSRARSSRRPAQRRRSRTTRNPRRRRGGDATGLRRPAAPRGSPKISTTVVKTSARERAGIDRKSQGRSPARGWDPRFGVSSRVPRRAPPTSRPTPRPSARAGRARPRPAAAARRTRWPPRPPAARPHVAELDRDPLHLRVEAVELVLGPRAARAPAPRRASRSARFDGSLGACSSASRCSTARGSWSARYS